MRSFTKTNNLIGWVVCLISGGIYLATVERTASFWDCGEFIASAHKLEVPHPPGTPLFLIIGRLFSLLAWSDPSQVAYWVNLVSVLCSAFTVLFLFWTISLLGLKLLQKSEDELSWADCWGLWGAAAVGSLAFAFSDSFWFSAVEAEVYAMSSFFTAFVFWAILKWERIKEPGQANRWLILIAYLVGLSIGVHILNLVALPVLALVYYYKKTSKSTTWGTILAFLAGSGIVAVILYGIIPGLPTLAGVTEVIFVNQLGLPFYSGIFFFGLLCVGALVASLLYSHRYQKIYLNTALLSLTFILIGYGSYALILIRANYNPPINLNNPSEVHTFIYYLNREQYVSRPLVYGPKFTSQYTGQEPAGLIYRKGENKYEVIDQKVEAQFDDNMLFPRVYSRMDDHPQRYRKILDLEEGEVPTMKDNLRFLFQYQLGHMYLRYLMWNFAGRMGDEQDAGWLSPLASKLPKSMTSNKAHNQFFMLPFLLGILGMIYQYRRSQQVWLINALFFFMTGMALVLYLNSPPVEPRERDYIYVGSFYAFAIWVGLGTMFLVEMLNRFSKNHQLNVILATLLGLAIPCLMLSEGWDDHNRAGRGQAVRTAKNLLSTCAPDSILFVAGDNETYPLWYAQEVEGYRRDVRVCNITLLSADWYAKQMTRPTYESEALPIQLDYKNYIRGTNDQIPYVPASRNPQFSPEIASSLEKKGMNVKTYLQLIQKQDPRLKYDFGTVELNTLPTRKLVLPLDSEKVKALAWIPADKKNLIQGQLRWEFPEDNLFRNHLIMLDIIANNDWERPIYFSDGLGGDDSYLGLTEYLQLEGLAYRLMPFRVEGTKRGYVNTEIMYDTLMRQCNWEGFDNPDLYLDAIHQRFARIARGKFYRLAEAFYQEGKKEEAREVMDFSLKAFPHETIAYGYFSTPMVGLLLSLEEEEKALEIADTLVQQADENLAYFIRKNPEDKTGMQTDFAILSQLTTTMQRAQRPEAAVYAQVLERHYQMVY